MVLNQPHQERCRIQQLREGFPQPQEWFLTQQLREVYLHLVLLVLLEHFQIQLHWPTR